jgi:dCMP deaminase
MPDWHRRYLSVADVAASWSKDRSTKVGCVIVGEAGQILSTGYNGFPRGVIDDVDERHVRPEKYLWTEHAERNAIYNAARTGTSLVGSTLYVQWHPCADCARGIIQSGIRTVILAQPVTLEGWTNSTDVAKIMFEEADVRVWSVDGR